MEDKDKKKQKSKFNFILTTSIGLILTIIGGYFFYIYIQGIMQGDYINSMSNMGIGLVLICAGMLVCLIPNSMRASKMGMQKSMEMYKEVMKETGITNPMMTGMMPGTPPGRIRLCVTCGRNIPFDANLCPYCGHQYS